MVAILIIAAIVLGLVGGALLSGAWRPKAIDRLMPDDRITRDMAAIVGLIRRNDEGASEFMNRVLAAHRELSAASTEFMNAAHEIGSFDVEGETYRVPAIRVVAVEIGSGRLITYRLPLDHPAAVRYAFAKRGDAFRAE